MVDLNRAPGDVDRATVSDHPAPRPTQPRGIVWRLTREGIHVIQIEINRALYVDERTGEPRTNDMQKLRNVLTQLVHKVGSLPTKVVEPSTPLSN